MRDKNSKRLVIDADVAQGAGGKNATHPRAKHCRDFLNTVLSLRHRVVMTEKISNEWKDINVLDDGEFQWTQKFKITLRQVNYYKRRG